MTDAYPEGQRMHRLARRLFPITRSLTGDGVRETLAVIGEQLPLRLFEVPTGTQVFDWTVPKEWNIRDAYLADEGGRRVIDFQANNLHVVGYSVPVDEWLTLEQLDGHLHSLPDQPDAVPYITSYYKERWGFCLTHRQREQLTPGRYHAVIDSELKDGHLTYAECILPGASDREVFLSTYVCHPSMANNELSGPVVMTEVVDWLRSTPRRYSYRILFIPETIGAITYLSRHLDHLKSKVVLGFNLSCIGDDRAVSYVASRYEDSLADRIVANLLGSAHPDHIKYPFLERGSDERQYCAPGVDLPLVTLCRSKFGCYPEYHTSLDDLELVTPSGLQGGFEMVKSCLTVNEHNRVYTNTGIGEPQLGKRGLYPDLGTKGSKAQVRTLTDFLAYADGRNDLVAISDRIGAPVLDLIPLAERLAAAGLIEEAV